MQCFSVYFAFWVNYMTAEYLKLEDKQRTDGGGSMFREWGAPGANKTTAHTHIIDTWFLTLETGVICMWSLTSETMGQRLRVAEGLRLRVEHAANFSLTKE